MTTQITSLKADSKGFLIADSATDISELVAGIEGVHSDTSAILALLRNTGKGSLLQRQKISNPNSPANQRAARDAGKASAMPATANVRAANTTATPRNAAPSRERDSRGRFIASTAKPASEMSAVAKAVSSLTRQQAAQSAADKRAEVSRDSRGEPGTDQPRDARGRFGSGAGSGRGGGSGGDGGSGMLPRLKSLFSGFSGGGTGDMDKVDPVVEAAKEVSQLAAGPLKVAGAAGKLALKGFGPGGKDKAIPWYQRIWSEIRLGRRQASDANAIQTRTLKDIEKKPGGSSESKGGGIGGMLGGLLKGGGGLIGGLMKRLPLLGALFAGGSALASIFGGDDPNKSAEENRKDRFTGAGSGIGALIGGGLGMLLGPVGAVVGAVLGDRVGELVGAWLSTVDWAAVGASITSAWDSTVGFVKDSWNTVTTKLSDIGKTVSATWTAIIDGAKAFLKDKFGVDIDAIVAKTKEVAAPVIEKAAAVAAPVVDAAKSGAMAVVDYGKERVTKMAEPISRAAGDAVDAVRGVFGKGSRGNKAALAQGMVNAGITDPNEQAMLMAQMDHESGGFRSMEENVKYKPAQFLKLYGKRAGITTEEQAKAILDKGEGATAEAMYGGAWGKKNLGNTEVGDGAKFKGRGFTQLTGRDNYTAASKATGLDLVNNPELASDPEIAAKIATWYWKSKDGLAEAGRAGDVRTATKKINGGFNGLDERSKGFVDYRKETLNPDFVAKTVAAGSVPGATKAAPAKAASASVVAAVPAQLPPVAVAAAPAVPSVSVPSISLPAAPSLPATAQAAIPMPMNSKEPMQVTVANDQPVGQDIGDRRLALIATGGLSA